MVIGAQAQNVNQQVEYPDAQQTLSYDIYEVVMEWDAWKSQETSANEFVGDFLEDFEVPLSGQHGLNRQETWYWWISNHPEDMDEYFERKEEAASN